MNDIRKKKHFKAKAKPKFSFHSQPPKIIFPNKSDFSKQPRGAIASAIERNDGIVFVRWKDNGVVTAGSTKYGVNPTVPVKRYSSEQKKNVTVPMPFMIHQYNKGMGGTDLMDQNINAYRINIRNKKWWYGIFSWLIDAVTQNAWILSKKQNNKMTQLNFRRAIAEAYLIKYAVSRKNPGPTGRFISSARVLEDIRYDRMDHWITHTPEKKRKRCAAVTCQSQVRTMCQKCKVGLCIDCFVTFHSKN